MFKLKYAGLLFVLIGVCLSSCNQDIFSSSVEISANANNISGEQSSASLTSSNVSHQNPTGQFKLTIVDPGEHIYDKDFDSDGFITPGDVVKLHAKPFKYSSYTFLEMYVNGEFRCSQTEITLDGNIVWEYSFEMLPCDTTLEFKVRSTDDRDVRTKGIVVGANYINPVEYLLGNCKFPFDIKDFGIDKVVAGDYLIVKYTGEWVEFESNPGEIVDYWITFVGATLYQGTVAEFELVQNPGGGVSLCPVDSSFEPGKFATNNCINKDGSFQDYSSYPLHTHIYGVMPVSNTLSSDKSDHNNVKAFYSFNPYES